MSFQHISLEKNESVVTIILNRPDRLNALNIPLAEEFRSILEECDREDKIRVAIIKAEGRAFCAGGDVKVMRDSLDKDPPSFFKRLTRVAHGIILAIRNLEKPVIAQVHGMASGAGFSLALACDLVVASKSAKFNLAYSGIGLSPDMGSSLFLPKLIGLQRASELFFMARIIDAEEGLRMGFVNQVVPDEKIDETTLELAMHLAQRPPLALAKTKALINQCLFRGLEAQLEAERTEISESAATEDFREGIKAFFEKRHPVFCGK